MCRALDSDDQCTQRRRDLVGLRDGAANHGRLKWERLQAALDVFPSGSFVVTSLVEQV